MLTQQLEGFKLWVKTAQYSVSVEELPTQTVTLEKRRRQVAALTSC
jgi:hypothetical protein